MGRIGVKKLGGKGEGGSYGVQPLIYRGKELKRPEELAEAWHEVAASKFGCTLREELRQPMAELGPAKARNSEVPRREILELCLAALKKSKAVGLDGIPCEAFQSSDAAKEDLFALVTQIWIQEQVPEAMSKSEMIPFYKNKGSSNDFTKYRMIGLINHAMKMVSTILLFYLLHEILRVNRSPVGASMQAIAYPTEEVRSTRVHIGSPVASCVFSLHQPSQAGRFLSRVPSTSCCSESRL
jgi:hypothetical protein